MGMGNYHGAAYVFRYVAGSGTWVMEAQLIASDGAADDYFGCSVAVSGEIVLIGARGDDDNGSSSGSAYVFRYDAGSGTWTEEAKLLPWDGAADDYFGEVSLSGEVAVIGASGDDDKGTDSGSAYVFRYDTGSGTWVQEAKLLPSYGVVEAYFGISVALSGETALIGASWDPEMGTNAGAAYVFNLNKPPLLDIQCNGGDQNVIVPRSDNVELTIDIEARAFEGTLVDIWIIVTPVISDNHFSWPRCLTDECYHRTYP